MLQLELAKDHFQAKNYNCKVDTIFNFQNSIFLKLIFPHRMEIEIIMVKILHQILSFLQINNNSISILSI